MLFQLSVPDKKLIMNKYDKRLSAVLSVALLIFGYTLCLSMNDFSLSLNQSNSISEALLFIAYLCYPATTVMFSLISITAVSYILRRKVDIADFMYAMMCNVLFLNVIVAILFVLSK